MARGCAAIDARVPLAALALVLVAAVLHAGWNLVAKKVGGGDGFVLLGAVFTVTLWAPAAWWFGEGVARWGPREWALVLASGVIHLVYFRTLLHGYRVADLTVVYPVARGTGPLVSSVAALAVFGERLGLAGGLGLAAVTGGVFLVAGGPRALARRDARVNAGLAWGALTGLFIATYTVLDAYLVKVLLLSPILVDWFGNLVRIPFLLPWAARHPDELRIALRTQWKGALVLAAISPLGYVLVLYAARIAPLSHVAPAREVSMLFAALAGGTLLGEADRGVRLLGAAAIAGGVVALATG